MAKINSVELLVDNYDTKEVINYAASLLKAGDILMAQALKEQNLGYAGAASMTYTQATGVLEVLNEKLNGKKEATVVQ